MTMRVCVLMGSPRENGNTAELCKPFLDELSRLGAEAEYIAIHRMRIGTCLGCYQCQHVAGAYGCPQPDDMRDIARAILLADIVVWATPVYHWQATPQMKAVMDRMYGFDKYYGTAPRAHLNPGLRFALLATCGYDIDHGAGLLDEAMRRWAKHSEIPYLGMYAVRDEDDLASFQTPEAVEGARAFAKSLVAALGN